MRCVGVVMGAGAARCSARADATHTRAAEHQEEAMMACKGGSSSSYARAVFFLPSDTKQVRDNT